MDYILNDNEFSKLEEIYKLFGSTTRLKILLLLAEKEQTVSNICLAVGLCQSAISHQLKDLKKSRIVKSKKVGLYIYYSLDDIHIIEMLYNGIHHIKGEHCNE